MTIKNHSRICLILSATIIGIALIMTLFGAGFNLGPDFAGEVQVSYVESPPPVEEVAAEDATEDAAVDTDENAAEGAAGNVEEIAAVNAVESTTESAAVNAEEIAAEVTEETATESVTESPTETAVEIYVGPAVAGAPLLGNTALSVLLIVALLFCYISFRFDLNSGLAASFGLVHDVLLAVSFVVILRIRVNASFVAAVLAIAIYSVINAVLTFAHLRERSKTPEYKKLSREEAVNLSVRENLPRTLYISLAALAIVLFLFIIGAGGVREIALPMLIGIMVSVYSANMINGYVWAALEKRKQGKKKGKGKGKNKAKRA